MNDILVVGAGFSGATIAHQLAEAGYNIHVIDKRDHLGGNAFDYINEYGIRIHKYGPHIFHTNNLKVVNYLKHFGDWAEYKHKVKCILNDGELVTIPPNLETAEKLGKENIIDVLFRPYTKKMWGLDLEQIDPKIIQRVAIRDDYNDLYFPNDKYQYMPKLGYTDIIKNMLDHPKITIDLSTSFDVTQEQNYFHIFNSMPIDEYYNFKFGALPYRSIKFHHINLPIPKIQSLPTINFVNDGKYTRITEWKNYPFHGECIYNTSLTLEEPCCYKENNNERYYPVKDLNGMNRKRYEKYKSEKNDKVTFIGRCGLYVYIDMHQAISSAMAIAKQFEARLHV
jgi:UDP-galactopyranose mutase